MRRLQRTPKLGARKPSTAKRAWKEVVPRMPTLQLVLVTWADAWTDNEAVTKLSAKIEHSPHMMHTLGWLITDDSEGIQVVTEFTADDFAGEAYRGRTFIPRDMVHTVRKFKLVKEAKKK